MKLARPAIRRPRTRRPDRPRATRSGIITADAQPHNRWAISHAPVREAIARETGLHDVYVGNVSDLERSSSYCSHCNARLIGRRGYTITDWNLNPDGACASCGTRLLGVIESAPGH